MKKSRSPGAIVLSVVTALGAALCVWGILMFLTSCSSSANTSPFLDVSLEFLGEYQLPKDTKIDGISVGGLSGLTFDRQRNLFYAISDDRSVKGPARFYTLKPILDKSSQLQQVEILGMTTLKNADGQTYPVGSIDPEAIALTPKQTILVSSEGDRNQGIPPSINEFDLQTGQIKQILRLPDRYLPDNQGHRGIRNNLAFESLTLAPSGNLDDPLNLFAATEAPLIQDLEPKPKDQPAPRSKNRWLHYLVGGQSSPLADYAYELDPPPLGSLEHGLSEIQALDNSGHFLTLERSLGLMGFHINLFQATTQGATDASAMASLAGSNITTMPKQSVLNLDRLKIKLDNIEGMAIGPKLADGNLSLLLVSDDNFNRLEVTQFLWFRLKVS